VGAGARVGSNEHLINLYRMVVEPNPERKLEREPKREPKPELEPKRELELMNPCDKLSYS
jgi:hypothetical protein